MRHFIRRHTVSFKHAFDGLFWAVRTQPNFRIHLIASLLALFLAGLLGISPVETAIIAFTIILCLTSEIINTSIEATVDVLTSEYHEKAKIAKDVSAGMMLLCATGAVVVGALIYIPYIMRWFTK